MKKKIQFFITTTIISENKIEKQDANKEIL